MTASVRGVGCRPGCFRCELELTRVFDGAHVLMLVLNWLSRARNVVLPFAVRWLVTVLSRIFCL